jgi:hypothetical protein
VSGGARGAIVIGLAVILGIVGLQILDDSDGGSNGGASTVSTSPGSAGATTTAPIRPNGEVRVKVYNSTGIQGKAQTLTDQLRAKGYNMQTPASLDKPRQGTVVECVPGFEREATTLALYGVDSGSTVEKYPDDPPEGASDADCIVVIGN